MYDNICGVVYSYYIIIWSEICIDMYYESYSRRICCKEIRFLEQYGKWDDVYDNGGVSPQYSDMLTYPPPIEIDRFPNLLMQILQHCIRYKYVFTQWYNIYLLQYNGTCSSCEKKNRIWNIDTIDSRHNFFFYITFSFKVMTSVEFSFINEFLFGKFKNNNNTSACTCAYI